MLAAFADVSIYQLLLVAGVALFASVLGGVAGYGTGALMPLVLVPMVGAEQVVPIIALAGTAHQHRPHDRLPAACRMAPRLLVLLGAIPPCLVTAYGYTLLTGNGAQLVIGTMLMLTVPLRYVLRRRAVVLQRPRPAARLDRLRRRGRRHGRRRRHAAVAADGGGHARRGGDRDRRHAVDRHRRVAADRCSGWPA